MDWKTLGVFVVAIFFGVFSFADVAVEATVDVPDGKIGVGESFTYSVTVRSSSSQSLGSPRLPDLEGFEILGQNDQVQTRSFLSGGTFQIEQTYIFNFNLAPKQTGALTIGVAEMVVGGQTYKTKPIKLQVTEGVQRRTPPQPQAADPFAGDPFLGGDPDDLFNQLLRRRGVQAPGGSRTLPTNPDEAFFIQVDVDKTQVYEGEQVTATYYLMTPHQVRDIDTLKYPSLKGFWKEDIEIATRLNFQREIVNGIPYNKALLASYALFPIKAGDAVVDPYKAKCTILTQMNMLGMGTPYQFTKASQPVKVKVKPLPKDSQPKDFSGAVGQFQISAKIEGSTNVPVNQPFTLKVRIEGRGNAKVIELPPLELPPDLELYDTKSDSKFFKDGTSYKEFQLLLIPRRTGSFTLPSLTVSSFDPSREQYVQSQTSPITINVGAGRASEQFSQQPLKSQPSREKRKDLPPVATELESGSWDVRLTVAFWLTVFAVLFVVLGWRAKVELGLGTKEKTQAQKAQLRLKQVYKHLSAGDYRKVGAEGLNAITLWLASVSQDGAADENFESLLQKISPSVRAKIEKDLRQHVTYFESLAFAPESSVEPLKAEARSRLKALEKLFI